MCQVCKEASGTGYYYFFQQKSTWHLLCGFCGWQHMLKQLKEQQKSDCHYKPASKIPRKQNFDAMQRAGKHRDLQVTHTVRNKTVRPVLDFVRTHYPIQGHKYEISNFLLNHNKEHYHHPTLLSLRRLMRNAQDNNTYFSRLTGSLWMVMAVG